MATIAKLAAQLDLDSSRFQRGMAGASASFESFGAKLRRGGMLATAAISAPIAAFAGFAINQASDLAEAQSAAAVTYGDAADSIMKSSQGAAGAVGLSQQQYLSAATTLGVFGSGAGLTGDALAGFGQDTIKAAADLASFYNAPVPEALEAIQAGLSGETEPLRRFGIFLNDATLQQYAMERGIWDGVGAMTEQQKVLARQGYILDNLGPAQDDFARTSSGLANQQRILSARFKDTAAKIGKYLLPAMLKIVTWAGKLFDRFEKLSPAVLKWGILIGVAAAAIGPLLLVLGTLVGAFAPLITILAFLLSPIGLVIAGLALLAYHFRGPIISGIKTVVGFLGDLFTYLKLVATGTGTAEEALKALPDWFEPIARQIGRVVDALSVMVNAFRNGGFSALMDVLPAQLARIGDAFGRIGEILLSALGNIDWAAVGSALWTGLQLAVGFLGDIAGTILTKLGNLTLRLTLWLWGQASSVDWAGVLASAASAAGDIVGPIVSKLGDLTFALSVWLLGQAMAVDWGGILSSAAGAVGNIVPKIIAGIGDLGTSLKTWYEEAIDKPDWENLGFIVGEKVGDIAQALAPKALEMIQGFGEALLSPTTWKLIAVGLVIGIAGIPAAIGYIGKTLGPKALEFLGGFLEGLGVNWPTVTAWFTDLPANLLAAVPVLSETLIVKGQEIITGIFSGLKTYWANDASPWLANLGNAALASVPGLLTMLQSKGEDLVKGVKTGLEAIWPEVQTWLADLGNKSATAVGSLISTLYQKGIDLLQGMIDGAAARWVTLQSNLAAIPGAIVSAVGYLGGILYGAGADAIQGLINGVVDKIPGLQTAVNTVVGLFNTVTNLGNSPWPMMIGAGRDSMDGLIIGVESRQAALRRTIGSTIGIMSGTSPRLEFGGVRGVSAAMTSVNAFSPGEGGGGNTYIIQQVTPQDLVDLMNDARAGKIFASQFGSELGRRTGS